MHDVVIRGGTVIDGTRAPARPADLGIVGDQVVEIGRIGTRGRREIDADGLAVLPGWVDVHTHYDGQATWDAELAPSSWHGVTTTVFGNCSVGFAPVRPGHEDFLINLMEGVEDIPGSALSDGIDFRWETFGEYLDALDETSRTMDIGAQLPHAALRFYVMGDRGADHAEVPTTDEIATMGELAVEAVRAGAFGFTTSRTKKHRAADGRFTPSLTACRAELLGIAEALGAAGVGVLQINSDFATPDEVELVRQMAESSGRPLSFSLIQLDDRPDQWRELLQMAGDVNARGGRMLAQVGSRPIGVLFGFAATLNPFMSHPGWSNLAMLPLDERLERLADPRVRTELLSQRPDEGFGRFLSAALQRTFELGDPPDYEPDPGESIAARAERAGCDPFTMAYDLMLANGGRALLYHPFENYSEGSLDPVREMILSPHTIAGLSDGGAHVGTICDGSFPTYLLTHWARDRRRGEKIPIEEVVHRQTQATATAVGLTDRGLLAPGRRADVNVIDLDALRIHAPELAFDLPGGSKRLLQRASGYRHTFVAGTETFVDGEWTGATPGRLVRSQA
jgi:N-acyl-D-aspartate/D-glutamate deacylase